MRVLFFLPLLFSTGPLTAQEKTVLTINRICEAYRQNRDFSGNVLVALNDKKIFAKSFGLANREMRIPIDESSCFNICSIAKQFTAVAIMLCEKRNLIRLDDRLTDFFPSLPYPEITIRQLLSHSSGLPDSEFLFKEWAKDDTMHMSELLPLLEEKKPDLVAASGTKFHYSNVGYMLLALIIEKVSKQSFANFLKEHIFTPAGMRSTSVGPPVSRGVAVTSNYIFDFQNDSAIQKTYFQPTMRPDWKRAELISQLFGNGNIYSTTGDLFKWQTALWNNRLVSEKIIDTLTRIVIPASVAGMQNYAYGFAVNYMPNDTMIFHNGGTLGYSTTLRRLRNRNAIVISLANTNRTNDPAEAITSFLLGERVILPGPLKETKLTRQQMERFIGRYEFGGRSFSIELRQDSLFRLVEGTAPLRLIPGAAGRLYYSDGSDRELIFDDVTKGQINLLKADGTFVTIKKTG